MIHLAATLQEPAFDPVAALIRQADASADGRIEASEWVAFLGTLGAREDGALEPRGLLARVAFLDQDGDGSWTVADIEAAWSNASRTADLTDFFLAALADADGDGSASEAERASFLRAIRAAPGAAIALERRIAWVRAVEALPPPPTEDRGRLVPPVVLAAFLPSLDADSNGTLTLDDLNALHRGADANGDGVLETSELASRAAPTFTRWEIDESARALPPRMPWQRTLEDALALVEASGKPLLICVNMDGENASETLAFGFYRDPEFVALVDGFIPVLASPDQREPLERDDRGRRLADRRFGRLLNSEHIAIEPELFARYFRENRVAPRHVGVSPAGEILFDLYLLQDLSAIPDKLRAFGVEGPAAPDPASLSLEELLASPDAALRAEVEARFVASERDVRAWLAEAALSAERATQHPELVRLALRDPDAGVRRAGALELAQDGARFPLDQVPAARDELRGDAEAERALLAGLDQAAGDAANPARAAEAAFLAQALRELELSKRAALPLDVYRWQLLLEGAPVLSSAPLSAADYDPAIARLEALDLALRAEPKDLLLARARVETLARLARIQLARGENPTHFLQDAERGAEDLAERLPDDGLLLGIRAFALYRMNNVPAAGEAAARALPALLSEAHGSLAGEVLEIHAAASAQELYDASNAGGPLPAGLVARALAACQTRVRHPAAGEADWVRLLDLQSTLRLFGEERQALRRGLARFPTSERLHGYLRFTELRDRGSRALEAAYGEEPLTSAPAADQPALLWFRGLAGLFAAEHDVRARDPQAAAAAYARSEKAFAASAEAQPNFAASAAHYQALALAGLARLQADASDLEAALEAALRALELAPGSRDQKDGLGKSPRETALELGTTLRERGNSPGATALEAALRAAGG
jgi:hypothetical protein